MGPDYIGPAVDHFQEITAQYPEVCTAVWAFDLTHAKYMLRGFLDVEQLFASPGQHRSIVS